MRALFAKRPAPYYIYAYDYRRNSAGVRVLHMLCDALIRSGYEAYVVAKTVSPHLMTPQLSEKVIALHRSQGVEPIVVYPEVVDGNPLAGNIVVRYLLNKPGFLAGSGVYGDNDILFAYMEDFLVPGVPDDHVMFMPALDLNIFHPIEGKREPGRVCYYRGRYGTGEIDPALLPNNAIEITQDYPDSWEGLADIFQRCETFYSVQASGLCAEAVLCGCVAIVLPGELAPERFTETRTGAFGCAWGMAPEELARARDTVHLAAERFAQLAETFWDELDHFIAVTQRSVDEYAGTRDRCMIERWLGQRILTSAQKPLVQARRAALPPLRLACILFDPKGHANAADLACSLNSLASWRAVVPGVSAHVVSAAPEPAKLADGIIWSRLDGDSVKTLNQVLACLDSDWLLLLTPGDELQVAGTLMLDLELPTATQCRMVYADAIYRVGENLGAAFRPDFNLDYLLSFPAGMAHHWIFRRESVLEAGGFDPDYAAALEFELIVRLIERDGMAGIGHIAEPLLIANAPVLRSNPDAIRVLKRHLQARGYECGEVLEPIPGHYRLHYGHLEQPLVSILVPTKDQLPIMRRCIESLLETTRYQNYEVIIIDNNSETPETLEWLAQLEQIGEDKVRIMRYPQPFNFSAINNAAAQAARGDYLVLLNNDTAIIKPDWLDALLNHAQRPEVGIVGAKLLFPNKTIQHAGVILGLGGPAEHPFIGEKMDAAGYMERLQVDQNYSAVTAACLMIRKSVYDEVGGMDEENFKVSYNDIDLCLKVGSAGYLIVWTPHAVLMHEGSVSQTKVDKQTQEGKRKRFVAEQDAMYAKWLPLLARDPAYNPNLSLVKPGGFKLTDAQISWRPLASWKPLPTVLAHPADAFGCGNYRVIQPFTAMQHAGLIDGSLSQGLMHVADFERYNPDAVILQRQISDERIGVMRRMKAFSRAFKVYELDDYLPNLPMKSVHRSHMPKDIVKSLRRGLSFVDRFVVSTEPLAEAFAGFHDDIRVVHNRLDPRWWRGLPVSQRGTSSKPRVGWAGGASHTGDLELIFDVVKDLAAEVEWVFFGMCPDSLRPYVHEFHPGVAINLYPRKLAELNLDLALAPVEENLFNECKSNLRLLEYGACAYPVVCSDVRCYAGDLPVTRVKNRYRDWVDAIRMHLSDADASAAQGKALQQAVRDHWMLDEQGLVAWQQGWLP